MQTNKNINKMDPIVKVTEEKIEQNIKKLIDLKNRREKMLNDLCTIQLEIAQKEVSNHELEQGMNQYLNRMGYNDHGANTQCNKMAERII